MVVNNILFGVCLGEEQVLGVSGSGKVAPVDTCGPDRSPYGLLSHCRGHLRSQQLFCKVHTRAMGRWGEDASGRLMGAEDSLVLGTVDYTSRSPALTTLKLQCGDAPKTTIATTMESAVGLILKQPLLDNSNVDLDRV